MKKTEYESPHNTKAVNFLDVTLDLGTESHKPYRKPNDRPLYVHVGANHPQNVLKQIPLGINKRLVTIYSTSEEFDRAVPDQRGYTGRVFTSFFPSVKKLRQVLLV